ncbi:MAG: hypothetical protein IJQ20_06345 [Paludibacteraceae bacterium]|nr:hypothetical protein [Paludibacteraceae bacterium]MBQ6984534.1 hypothetical protein [Paludibacteraceae bacterium]
MGADVTHIAKHKFKDLHDLTASKKFVINTAFLLKTQLHDDVCVRRKDVLWKDIEQFGWEKTLLFEPKDDYPPEFSIKLNRYDVELVLRHGFWQINSHYRLHSLVATHKGCFWLRDMISDIVRALGETEVWHANEYLVEDIADGFPEIEDITFEQWLDFVQKEGVTEFDESYWLAHQDSAVAVPSVFHDNLTAFNDHFNAIQTKWPAYQLVGLFRSEKGHIGIKNNQLYWLNDDGTATPYDSAQVKNIDLYSDVENYVNKVE